MLYFISVAARRQNERQDSSNRIGWAQDCEITSEYNAHRSRVTQVARRKRANLDMAANAMKACTKATFEQTETNTVGP